MSATKIPALAAGIKDAIDAADVSHHGNGLIVYLYEPRDLDTLPAVTIEGPTTFRRPAPDEAQSQLGTFDWYVSFTLRLYVAFEDPEQAAQDVRALLGQVMAALDADRGLGGAADIDSALVEGTLGFTPETDQRRMAVFECSMECWALVA